MLYYSSTQGQGGQHTDEKASSDSKATIRSVEPVAINMDATSTLVTVTERNQAQAGGSSSSSSSKSTNTLERNDKTSCTSGMGDHVTAVITGKRSLL